MSDDNSKTKRTVQDIIYQADRKAHMRGKPALGCTVFLGFNQFLQMHVCAIQLAPDAPAFITTIGRNGIENLEQLTDFAFTMSEQHNAKLTIYHEPGYK